MNAQHLKPLQDPLADVLDDMAALGEHWKRNRDRGRMPNFIRQAMVLVAREALMHDDMEKRGMQQRVEGAYQAISESAKRAAP